MELHTHNPQQAYNPAWGSAPPTPSNWNDGSLNKLYDKDLFAWANTNAQLLRERKYEQADIDHLIEEIEDMGNSLQNSIYSHLLNLIMHLLKWEFQAELQSRSWGNSIVNARVAIARLIRKNPSLHSAPAQDLADAYGDARKIAAQETGKKITVFPTECPYTIEQILNEGWLPQ